jgi:hydroxyethylthiazole kinase-like uncharacterized protein yjeF
MVELLTAAQMRAIEAAAIASGEVTGLELMERAGRGVVSAIFAEWPELAPSWGPTPKPPEYFLQDDEKGKHRAVVLCGPGNNGGDGFVVARLLFEAGWSVEVFLYGDAEKLPPDARVNYERWCEVGNVFGEIAAIGWSCGDVCETDLIIDALFGIGLIRPIEQPWREIIDKFGSGGSQRCVAVDIPSGFNADSGELIDYSDAYLAKAISYTDPQLVANFNLTVTFHRMKVGHTMAACAAKCGKIVIVDIGL